MSVVIDRDGRPVSYEAAVNLMDDELRELLHANLAPCSEQEFFRRLFGCPLRQVWRRVSYRLKGKNDDYR